jgi:lipocalin
VISSWFACYQSFVKNKCRKYAQENDSDKNIAGKQVENKRKNQMKMKRYGHIVFEGTYRLVELKRAIAEAISRFP